MGLRRVAWTCGIALALSGPDAFANDAAAAQQLFDEAKTLLTAGRYAEACAKLAESQRLDPSPGTLFQLSDCNERIGRTASAWVGFLEVAGAANAAGKTAHEALARQRAKALEGRLLRLRIVVGSEAPGDLVVERDGVEVGRPSWGAEIPVDPGPHVVRANARGRAPFEQSVRVVGEGSTTTVVVPALAVQDAEAPPPLPPKPIDEGRTQRTVAVIAGGVGIAGVAIGSYFGVHAISLDDESAPYCRADNRCSARGVDLRDDALASATVSTVAIGLGSAILVSAVVLWLIAPSRTPAAAAGARW